MSWRNILSCRTGRRGYVFSPAIRWSKSWWQFELNESNALCHANHTSAPLPVFHLILLLLHYRWQRVCNVVRFFYISNDANWHWIFHRRCHRSTWFFLLSSFYFTCSPTYNFAIYGVKCHKSCVRFRFFVLMLCFFPVYICSNCQQFTFYLSAFAAAASVAVVGSFLPSSCCLFYLYCILVYAAGGGGCCALKFWHRHHHRHRLPQLFGHFITESKQHN